MSGQYEIFARLKEYAMAELSGAEAFFEAMVREGAGYLFGNPGTTELPLMDLFAAREEVRYILALHEDSAVGMAAGYAEATGKAAVVNLHALPGLAHGLGNLYNAARAGTPLVVTAGQQDSRAMLDEPLLYGDMLPLVRQHTKWSWEVRHAAEVPRAMARAFQIAGTPPTGPVFVSLPVDTLEERAEMEFPAPTRAGSRLRPDPEAIQQAAALLAQAKKPIIIAGDGCARAGAVAALVHLAESLGGCVYTEPLNALLGFPTDHFLYGGPLFADTRWDRLRLDGADVILAAGVKTLVPLVHTGTPLLPPAARLIQIDVDERQLGKNFPAQVAIHADLLSAIEELQETLRPMFQGQLLQRVTERREQIAAVIRQGRETAFQLAEAVPKSSAITPAFVARELRAVAAPDALLVDESVTSTPFVRGMFGVHEPNSYFFAKGGSLGFGLPFAVGVQLARPEKQVICAVGDGSALYSIQALWSAATYRLPVVFVVFNNQGYMILKRGLLTRRGLSAERGVFPGMDIASPEIDFVRMAESMGVAARRVSHPNELRPALDWALRGEADQERRPVLVDVAIVRDPAELQKLSRAAVER
jgi:benzoylformate decarboxylase